MEAYGMTKIVDGKKTWLTESETVARLFEMYEEITKQQREYFSKIKKASFLLTQRGYSSDSIKIL